MHIPQAPKRATSKVSFYDPDARPWHSTPNSTVRCTQVKYFWKSSIPTNWGKISSAPTRKIRGCVIQVRNTLDFLLQTQRYIQKIRAPVLSSEPVLVRTVSRKSTQPSKSRSQQLSAKPTFRGKQLVVLPHHSRSDFVALQVSPSQGETPRSARNAGRRHAQKHQTKSLGSASDLLKTEGSLTDLWTSREGFGLLTSRAQSPVNSYIRLSKTSRFRNNRLAS